MKTEVKVLSTVATSLAGLSGLTAHADVNQPVNLPADTNVEAVSNAQSTATVIPSSAEIKPQVDSAEQAVNDAQVSVQSAEQAVASQEQVISNAQANVQSADSSVATATAEVSKAQEVAQSATPEAIATAKDKVTEAENKVTSAQVDVADAQANADKATQAVEAQKAVVADAHTAVSNAQSTVAEAQKAVIDATPANATQSVSEAQATVTSISQAVESDKANVQSTESAYTQATQNLENKKTEVATKVATLQSKINATTDSNSQVVQHVLGVSDAGKAEELRAQERMKSKFGFANEDVNYTGTREETIVVDKDYWTSQHTDWDWAKVSQYAKSYIDELRELNGLEPTGQVTDEVLAFALARGKDMAEKNKLYHNRTFDSRSYGLTSFGDNVGITYGNNVVNLLPDKSEKELAYSLILGLFTDYSNFTGSSVSTDIANYGHRSSLLLATGNSFGVGGANGTKYSGLTGYSSMVFASSDEANPVQLDDSRVTVTNSDSDSTKTEYYLDGKRVKFLPETTFKYVWEETVTTPNSAKAQAQAELDAYKSTSASEIAQLETAVSNARTAYAQAQAQLSYDQARLTKAQSVLASLTTSKSDADAKLAEAQAQLAKANQALATAQAKEQAENATLLSLVQVQNVAFRAVETAKTAVSNAEAEVTIAKNQVSALENATANVETAKANLVSAEGALNEAQATLVVEQSKLPTLKSALGVQKGILAQAVAVYNQVKAEYDSRVSLENIAKENDVMTLADGTVVAVPKSAPTADELPAFDIDAYVKAEEDKAKSDAMSMGGTQSGMVVVQKNSETKPCASYSRVEKANQLPQTGEEVSILTLLGASLLVGFGFNQTSRRKKTR